MALQGQRRVQGRTCVLILGVEEMASIEAEGVVQEGDIIAVR